MTIVQIEVRNVVRTFEMGETTVYALNGASMFVRNGEFVVILGPSGSGKTTLLNMIGGIDKPTTGEVIIDGKDLTELSMTDLTTYRRNSVGWIFQFYNLIPSLTALENVALALELSEDTKNLEQRSLNALTMVGLSDKVDRFPAQLSGGEQQRVAIARALVKNPTILVADEPTGNLDRSTGEKVVKVMRELNQKEGITFVVVTHDTSLTQVADRTLYLQDGVIIKEEEMNVKLDIEKAE
ncbi:MAG: ABC transporter ATP-binding protein [Candidatus Heimdallarchaeota archaeon]